jgi:betaine lipid synthase
MNGIRYANGLQVMDSMDWFNPDEDAAAKQAQALNRAMKMGGRILLRSASIEPWYIKDFEANGFSPRRVGARFPGSCIDRYVLPLSIMSR